MRNLSFLSHQLSGLFKACVLFIVSVTLGPGLVYAQQSSSAGIINMIFSSDAHYGITRDKFRGDTNVSGHIVNAAMINNINNLPALTLPADGGIGAAWGRCVVDALLRGRARRGPSTDSGHGSRILSGAIVGTI